MDRFVLGMNTFSGVRFLETKSVCTDLVYIFNDFPVDALMHLGETLTVSD